VENKRMIDLGCGCGVASITASRIGAIDLHQKYAVASR